MTRKRLVLFAVLVAVFVVTALPAAAQSTTITVDTDVLFSSVNQWIATFLPVLAIPIGIAIALALLWMIGSQIVNAFKGRSSTR